ncbi:hypothetical protein [Bacillus sp. ISL-45]|uniref:hypothetical protein n=1 Tax=Bacillus sp. ISL-45 TaxID=2819128 RepID=UPI001BEA25A2|nr:hypothetical protein [Bacillus sp. ISL-45]MBT2663884.1 hypothetical protein [Bacillus sp. ISL-45]
MFFTKDPSQVIEQKRVVEASENAIFESIPAESAILKKQLKWNRDDESEIQLVNVNVDLSTKIGEFSNCIEVIQIFTYESMKGFLQKKYYCPKVGEVLSYYKTPKSKDFKIYSELLYIASPGDPELGKKYFSEKSETSNDEDQKDEVGGENRKDTHPEEYGENYSTSHIGDAVSGPLPDSTGKVSTLSIDEYKKAVN